MLCLCSCQGSLPSKEPFATILTRHHVNGTRFATATTPLIWSKRLREQGKRSHPRNQSPRLTSYGSRTGNLLHVCIRRRFHCVHILHLLTSLLVYIRYFNVPNQAQLYACKKEVSLVSFLASSPKRYQLHSSTRKCKQQLCFPCLDYHLCCTY